MVKTLQIFVLTLLMTSTTVVNANEQIDATRFMEGRWNVVAHFFEDGKWATPKAPELATAERVFGSAFIRMDMPVAFPGTVFQFEITLSYDRFNNAYRLAALDDVNGYMDIYSGQMKDGMLTVTNATTGTAFPDGEGGFVYGKIEIQQTPEGFQFQGYTSSQAQGPFAPYMRLEFTPVAEIETDEE